MTEAAVTAAQLADTLAAADKLARRMFAEQLKARGDKLLRYPPAPPPDLSPPPQVRPLGLGSSFMVWE